MRKTMWNMQSKGTSNWQKGSWKKELYSIFEFKIVRVKVLKMKVYSDGRNIDRRKAKVFHVEVQGFCNGTFKM